MTRCHEINSHEINRHQINSHEINLPQDQLSRDQLVMRSNEFFLMFCWTRTSWQVDLDLVAIDLVKGSP